MTPKENLIEAAHSFLEHENCETCIIPIGKGLFVAIGTTDKIKELIEITTGTPQLIDV